MATKLTERLAPLAAFGPLIALVVASVFFATQSDRFLTLGNLSLILQQITVVGTIAIGQTLVILTAGIDLSCGMLMAFGIIVMSKFAVDLKMPAVLAFLCGVLVTGGFGALNGALVTRVRLPPFIVTLGTLNIAFACAQLYSHAQTITDVPESLTALGDTFTIAGAEFTGAVPLMLALYVLVWWILRDTAYGRHVYAVGNNPEAARLTGIPTARLLFAVYTIAGVFYGIAALLSIARTGVGNSQAGQTENLDSITAVVLGGTSLFGGRGGVMGTLIGAMIVGVFRNGLTLMGVPSVIQILITGLLVILAVMTDQMSRRGGAR